MNVIKHGINANNQFLNRRNVNHILTNIKNDIKSGKLKLTKSQHISVTYYEDLIKPIPRDEITKHYEFIKELIPTAVVVGSYRRGEKTSSDIDIIVRQSMVDVVSELKRIEYIREIISQGSKKFSGIVKLPGDGNYHRHIDIIFTTPRAYPFALLYFTGSKKFNILMRLKAKNKGLKLNEYGLWKGITLISGITTERDIFKALDTPYINPSSR